MTKKLILSQVWMVYGGLVNFGSYCVGRCPQSFLLLRYIHIFFGIQCNMQMSSSCSVYTIVII